MRLPKASSRILRLNLICGWKGLKLEALILDHQQELWSKLKIPQTENCCMEKCALLGQALGYCFEVQSMVDMTKFAIPSFRLFTGNGFYLALL